MRGSARFKNQGKLPMQGEDQWCYLLPQVKRELTEKVTLCLPSLMSPGWAFPLLLLMSFHLGFNSLHPVMTTQYVNCCIKGITFDECGDYIHMPSVQVRFHGPLMEEDSGKDLEGNFICCHCEHYLQAHDTVLELQETSDKGTNSQTKAGVFRIHTKRVQLYMLTLGCKVIGYELHGP